MLGLQSDLALSGLHSGGRLTGFLSDALLMHGHLTRFLVFLDGKGVDGFVTGLADRLGDASQFLRKPQTGFVRSYALSIFGGSLVVVLALLAARLA